MEDTLRNCRFIEPPIQYLDIIKGPTESVFSKPCIIEHNGQIISGCGPVCTEYSYILKARWAGTFKIPPASIVVKGEVYKSSEAIIKVVESGRSLDQDSNANKSSSGNNYNNKNYYNELTDDLKLLIDIFKYTITDNTIEADDSDIGNMKYLNYYYVKDGNINTYTIVTNFGKYSFFMKSSSYSISISCNLFLSILLK